MSRMYLAAAVAVAAICALPPAPARSQESLPAKAVTMVVGFAAGGAADAAARLIAKKLSDNIGQSIVVDNRGGAGGNIAHQMVANGPADGSVILLGSIGPLTIAPHLMKLPYDPFKDFAPVSGGVNFPNILVVHKGVGATDVKSFVAAARRAPGALTFASTGAGSASHLAGELFNLQAGVEMTHVPYKGGAPAMVDVLGERVSGYFAAPPTALPQIQAGRIVPLATTGLKRPDYLPDIPTVAESGFPGFEALNWYAFVAPARTPAAILDRWNAEIVKVLNDGQIREALASHGLTPQPTSRQGLTDFMREEYAKWGAIVRDRRITMN